MARIEVLPHPTAPCSAWDPSAWMVKVDDGPPTPVTELVHGWDYDSVLRLATETTVHAGMVREACQLATEAALELVCIWDCPSTNTRRVGHRARLPADGTTTIRSVFEIPRRTVAERVTLERQVVVVDPAYRDGKNTHLHGAIVLLEHERERASFSLEGTGGRFPVEAVSFAALGLREGAWRLDVAMEDPEDLFPSAVRLYINTDHPAINELLLEPESVPAKRTLSVMQWDVARRLLSMAESDARYSPARDYEEGSFGAVIARLSWSVLKRRDVESLFALVRADPTRYEVLLQERLRLLHGD